MNTILFDFYHYLEQNGGFALIPEKARGPGSQGGYRDSLFETARKALTIFGPRKTVHVKAKEVFESFQFVFGCRNAHIWAQCRVESGITHTIIFVCSVLPAAVCGS